MNKVDWPESGTYVLAISGGIDSVVLLDLFSRKQKTESTKQKDTNIQSAVSNYQLIVAHLDHGIREDSEADRRFVEELAYFYDCKLEYKTVNLGKNTSEEEARNIRYEFLNQVVNKHHAKALVTAHHRDDVIETAIHNLLRGTYRSGVTSLSSTKKIKRPLLKLRKTDIREYAAEFRLEWVEDATNTSLQYRRNYIRHRIIPQARRKDSAFIDEFYSYIQELRELNEEIDVLEERIFPRFIEEEDKGISLKRSHVINLNHLVAKELIVYTLKQYTKAAINEERINNAWMFIKTAKPDSVLQFDKHTEFSCTKKYCTISRK